MTFATPLMLLLLLPLGLAAWRLLRRGRRSGIRFSATSRLPAKTAGWRAKLASLTPFILLAGLALLIVAAARPRTPLAHDKKSIDAIAIAMTVDVSGSMDALDLAPSGTDFRNPSKKLEEWTRLSVVKRLFAEFVPLTMDHEMLLHALKGVEIPSTVFDAQGNAIGGEDEANTAIGDGLATALLRLKDAKPKSKIVILLSDGVSNTGVVEPKDAAATAAKMGVKVYCIGIGTALRRTPRLVRDGYGRYGVVADRMTFDERQLKGIAAATGAMSDRMTFDERQLKGIAAATGAMYFPVNDRDSLEKALAEIDQLETTKLDADAYDRWDEHFAAFLFAGAVLVFLAVSLSMFASRRLA